MPLEATTAAAPSTLQLPAISTKAQKRVRNRREYVAVEQAMPRHQPPPQNTTAFIVQVAALLTHYVYHYPGMGLQAICYIQ